jgi:tetratricopeptide (TPR) repeat protein
VALEGLRRHREADAAFRAAFARARAAPKGATVAGEGVPQRISLTYAFAVSGRLPARAREEFEGLLQHRPDHPHALYGLAMLLVRQRREREALALLDRAVAASPRFADARRHRGILLARAGRVPEATRDVDWCLAHDPSPGAAAYVAACVAALAVPHYPNPTAAKQAAEQALAFLRQALAHGYGREQAATDPDLKAIRRHPKFLPLLRG